MGFGEGGGGARTKATHGNVVRGRRSHAAFSADVWSTLSVQGAPLQDKRSRASPSLVKGRTMARKGGKGLSMGRGGTRWYVFETQVAASFDHV